MQHTESALATDVDHNQHLDEVGELFATLLVTPPERLTACRGWTAHELVAHLAAGAREEADLIEAHLAGRPRATRPFEDREPAFRALPDAELRDRLVEEGARLTNVLDALAARDVHEPVEFTGRPMTRADFAMHSRSECALHRWDLVGRDDVGWAMLAQPALTKHSLGVLSAMATLPEAPANRLGPVDGEPVRIVLRSAPHDDVVVTLSGGVVALALVPIGDTAPTAELDPAARLLALWGRREPSAPIDVNATGAAAGALTALFGW